MYANCQVTIKSMVGNESNKSLATQIIEVNALILPASEQIVALYPDIPIGQAFTIACMTDQLPSLLAESEITVTDPLHSELGVNQRFIVKYEARKNKVGGQFVFTANLVKVA